MPNTQEQMRLVSDVKKCESRTGMTGVLSIAAALKQFATTVRDVDADPLLLNVANGTLDLHSLELSPHSPADRSPGSAAPRSQRPV